MAAHARAFAGSAGHVQPGRGLSLPGKTTLGGGRWLLLRRPALVAFILGCTVSLLGHGPWSLWLLGLGVIWSFLPATSVFVPTTMWLLGAGVMVVVWSAYIDFCFFRFVLGRNRARAGRDLLVQRLMSWALIVLIFGAPGIGPEVARWFGR
jgi:hypothetical protein